MKATLDGFVIPVDAGFGWSYIEGTAPERREFRMNKALADAIYKDAKPDESTLVIDATEEGFGTQTIEKLTVLSTGPTDNPNESVLAVADVRWRWTYGHVWRAYNVRGESGNRRRVNADGPQATDNLVDDVIYQKWSINPNTRKRWRPEEVVEDVMNVVAGARGTAWRNRSVLGTVGLPPIEEMFLDGSPAAVLGQLLAELGLAISVFVDKRGQVVLYNRLDDTERRLVGAPEQAISTRGNAPKPLIFGSPTWSVQDNSKIRPRDVIVLIERRQEMRFDARDSTATTTVDDDFPDPNMTNVLYSPEDFTHNGREILVGQVVSVDFYLSYLAGKQPSGLPQLTKNVVNRGWLHGVLEAYSSEILDPSGLWARRIDAIREHYRLTYQIDRTWRERIRDIQPEVLSVQDSETGARAQSPVYANYAQFETWRSRGKSVNAQPKVYDQVRNRYANPSGSGGGAIVGTSVKSLKPAKAIVTLENPQQGIIRFSFGNFNDASRRASEFVRSALTSLSIPTDDISLKNLWLQEGVLEETHEVSTLLTCTIESPPDLRRYHAIRVTQQEAKPFMPSERQSLPDGTGPTMYVRIPPSLVVAKFGWDDTKRVAINTVYSEIGDKDQIKDILGLPINAKQLEVVAKARAAVIYSQYADRVEGGARLVMDPSLSLRGTATRVSWEASPQDGAVTDIDLPAEAPGVEFLAVLPPAVRRRVSRYVNNE
jgi:hypothetical protein